MSVTTEKQTVTKRFSKKDLLKIKEPYYVRLLDYTVLIFPEEMNQSIEQTIISKSEKIKEKQREDFGIITDIVNIINITNENVNTNGTYIFKVRMKVVVYNPKKGDVFSTKIKNIMEHGFYTDEPLKTFVCFDTSKSKNSKMSEGDSVKIQINKISVHENKLVVIAKQIIDK